MAAEYEIVDSQTTLPPPPATSYLTTDYLGSPRVIADGDGVIIAKGMLDIFAKQKNISVNINSP